MKQIGQFEGDFHFLSNFFIEPDLTTVEHEFQAAKTHDLRRKVEILSVTDRHGLPWPGEAKRMGRKAVLRPDWEQVKVHILRELVLRKFWDHEDLASALLSTGDAELIEGNYWHDTIWGVCTGTQRCRKGPHAPEGTNHLGIALMDVRAVIRSFDK